jgi:serine/threonine protein kinase/tetratricopeptide (TPR) repeat protein
MIGKTVSHFKILSKLGEGGMGVVYKAEDTRLRRTVALKFLPPELTRDRDAKERFIQEAQSASALDHPNICTVHEIDETAEGRTFIAMACYEGESLKSKIERGPLRLDEALDIAVQIAQGLTKAHSQGIIHRDIKPANILITKDGLVKIVDFGLAKLAGMKLTKTGWTLGTAQYMSPEQARGEKADARSDIFSLGAVLYEMISGRHAFPGEYEQATLYAIMNAEPEPVTALRSGIPMELERIVKKALAKKPSERYQHADDLIVDLKKVAQGIQTGAAAGAEQLPAGASRRSRTMWITVASVIIAAIAISAYFTLHGRRASKEPAAPAAAPVTALRADAPAWTDSVAVLPFKDFSPEKDQEYFCDGMTDDIITKLSNVHDLKVISRTSAMRYKNTDKSIREIGQELGVSAVLEGSIQKESDRIRINAQLIRASDDGHLWAEKYDRRLESVFDIQDEISMAIVDALEMKLTLKERQGITERPIDDVAAYQCYLKANSEIWRFSESSVDSARLYLQKGIDILGDNPLLYSAMAMVYCQYVNIGVGQEDYIAKAEDYAQKALSLDPNSPQAHQVMGIINLWFYGNLREGISQLKMALAVSPNDQQVLRILPIYYIVSVGKPALAIPLVRRFQQLDPLDPWDYSLEGALYWMDGRYGLSLEQYRRWYQSDPDNPHARFIYALALTYEKEFDEAFSIIDRGAETTADNVFTKFGLLLKYGLLKEKEKALREVTPDFEKTCRRDQHWSYWVAVGLALADAKEESIDWLENAVNKGFINYPELERNPYFDNLRGEDRFKKLLERVKYEWEHFEV